MRERLDWAFSSAKRYFFAWISRDWKYFDGAYFYDFNARIPQTFPRNSQKFPQNCDRYPGHARITR